MLVFSKTQVVPPVSRRTTLGRPTVAEVVSVQLQSPFPFIDKKVSLLTEKTLFSTQRELHHENVRGVKCLYTVHAARDLAVHIRPKKWNASREL